LQDTQKSTTALKQKPGETILSPSQKGGMSAGSVKEINNLMISILRCVIPIVMNLE
jgi:hypothetical protein